MWSVFETPNSDLKSVICYKNKVSLINLKVVKVIVIVYSCLVLHLLRGNVGVSANRFLYCSSPQCLSRWFLKPLTDVELMTSSGREFQSSTTRWLNTPPLTSLFILLLYSFWPCPLVLAKRDWVRILLTSSLSMPLTILYTCIISPLLSLCCSDGSFKYFKRSV